jgi:hypothetical protein
LYLKRGEEKASMSDLREKRGVKWILKNWYKPPILVLIFFVLMTVYMVLDIWLNVI